MKKPFCINFILGSILLIILFLNVSVISLDMTFRNERENNYISYIIMSVVDIIYFCVIVAINRKLIKSNKEGINSIILNCIFPLLLPTLIAILIISIKGIFESNKIPVVSK